jgi:hypothetical protein
LGITSRLPLVVRSWQRPLIKFWMVDDKLGKLLEHPEDEMK